MSPEVEKVEKVESFSYIAPPSICPSCQQPFIRADLLRNPDRLIYVHRQSTGASKNAIDWCVDPTSRREQQARLSAAIEACNQINEVEVEKGVDRRLQEMTKSKSSVMVPTTGSHSREVTQELGFSTQSKRGESMAFVGFDLVKLKEEFPIAAVGRAGKPSVAISDKGRITFSTEVSRIFDGCKFVIPSRDKDNQLRIRFDGHPDVPKGKEGQVIELSRPKPSKDGKKAAKTAAIQAVVILKHLKYDFTTAGNQTYDVEKMDNEKHVVIFSLPATLPAKKAKKPRVKKVKAATVTNGVPVAQAQTQKPATGPQVVPPASNVVDDLAIEE